MDKIKAIQLLESSSPHQRLQGARFFARNYLPDILPELKEHFRKERVAHVRAALNLAVKRNSQKISKQKEETDDVVDSDDDLFLDKDNHDAVDKWVGILLHEIEPKVGLIKVSAKKEISNFENSETNRHLDGLSKVLRGFANLRLSILPPRNEEFDLADLITDILRQETTEDVDISIHGQTPFLIKSDENLLQLAVSNGIRNALEAVKNNKDKKKIVVTWGVSDVEYYVSIIDNGPGFPEESTDFLFQIGNTSKSGHEGFGLAIIRQALENLGGSANLDQSKKAGAKLHMKWGK